MEYTLCHMWIAGPASESFGLNLLEDGQIASGESLTSVVYTGTYDLKTEDCDWAVLRGELDVRVSGHQTWSVP